MTIETLQDAHIYNIFCYILPGIAMIIPHMIYCIFFAIRQHHWQLCHLPFGSRDSKHCERASSRNEEKER